MTTEPHTPGEPAGPPPAGPPPAAPLDFGPSGYLPERASKRARKIVLRAPMGIQWVVAALVVGVIVIVAGLLALRDGTPSSPYEPVATVTATGGVITTSDGLLLLLDGRPRVFAAPTGAEVVLCAASDLLEQPGGGAWRVTGRGLDGVASLAEHPSLIHDGEVYADLTTTVPTLASSPADSARGCS
jgi:hypothetical protein